MSRKKNNQVTEKVRHFSSYRHSNVHKTIMTYLYCVTALNDVISQCGVTTDRRSRIPGQVALQLAPDLSPVAALGVFLELNCHDFNLVPAVNASVRFVVIGTGNGGRVSQFTVAGEGPDHPGRDETAGCDDHETEKSVFPCGATHIFFLLYKYQGILLMY